MAPSCVAARVDIATNSGGDFQHAFGDVMFSLTDAQSALHVVDEKRRGVSSGRSRGGLTTLKLQFNPEGEGGAVKVR